MRTTPVLATLAIVCLGSASPVQAQGVVFRLGGGVVTASEIGLAGLVALEGRWSGLILRAEGRPIYMPEAGEQGGQAGAAVGLRGPWTAAAGRPYFLATFAYGADLREGDSATGVGAVVGSDLNRGLAGVFLELRYEHLSQEHPYFRIPPDQVTLLLGFRVGRP